MPDIEPIWQAVIALASSGTIVAGIQLFRDLSKRRSSKRLDRGYQNIHTVYTNMQEFLSDSQANRVFVLKSENGGGIPAPGVVIKNSALFEVCSKEVTPAQDAWQNVLLDKNYSDIIVSISTNGFHKTDVKYLDSTTNLFSLFSDCSCDRAYFYRICATPSALLYLGVYYQNESKPTAHERLEARKCAQRLCSIFEKHHNIVKRHTEIDS